MILDVDPGSDDAVAMMIALKSPNIDLKAVCTVAGNKSIDMTTENALRVVQAVGADVPVYKGCGKPVFKHEMSVLMPEGNKIDVEIDGKVIRMHDDYLELPASTRAYEKIPAASFYVEYLRAARAPIVLVATGPLTNLAVALMMAPDIVDHVAEIVIMGGGHRVTNVTNCAEANTFSDPHAAKWVLHSGAKITWVPLDATHMAAVPYERCVDLRGRNTLATNFVADLIEQRIKVHNVTDPLGNAAPVHDALAVCAVIDRSVLQDVRAINMDISTAEGTIGQTVLDMRYTAPVPNCSFAFGADREKFSQMLLDILSN